MIAGSDTYTRRRRVAVSMKSECPSVTCSGLPSAALRLMLPRVPGIDPAFTIETVEVAGDAEPVLAVGSEIAGAVGGGTEGVTFTGRSCAMQLGASIRIAPNAALPKLVDL